MKQYRGEHSSDYLFVMINFIRLDMYYYVVKL
jgi:hypothetical protein